jgi:hypothetical protein
VNQRLIASLSFFLLSFFVLLPAAPAAETPPAPKVMPKSVAVDTNKDGKPDRWEIYENGVLARIETDSNFDGKADEWVYAENGKPAKLEKDSDYDGKVDQWVTY